MGSRAVRGLVLKMSQQATLSMNYKSLLPPGSSYLQLKSFNRNFQSGVSRLAEYEASANPNQQLHASQGRMEKTVNHVNLMGRVGGDPQKRGTQEHPVVVFSVATHSNYNYQTGGVLQKTDWHRICVFKPYLRDSVYKYLNKGQRVYVTGRISYGEIKDESGASHTTTSIIADDVIFISSTPTSKSSPDEDLN
ncbi:Single-stranded DNA-binding protein, mitochondrial [Orchesella cincta]|uniref:Single-stranded DNA-binding protein, mitochondrial n=1 Tax=Orchesella cincta TaxID=48709 RepID=A0A1D2N849_ORCCI|nr:Single-stranded DNA-binding protein, mitochondrial [Orchesella cincta]